MAANLAGGEEGLVGYLRDQALKDKSLALHGRAGETPPAAARGQ